MPSSMKSFTGYYHLVILDYFGVFSVWFYLYVFITKLCMHISLINAHADIFSNARALNFKSSLHLHPYFVYARSEC